MNCLIMQLPGYSHWTLTGARHIPGSVYPMTDLGAVTCGLPMRDRQVRMPPKEACAHRVQAKMPPKSSVYSYSIGASIHDKGVKPGKTKENIRTSN